MKEPEKIDARDLAKFRKVQSDLEQADGRADIKEHVSPKYKANSIYVAVSWVVVVSNDENSLVTSLKRHIGEFSKLA